MYSVLYCAWRVATVKQVPEYPPTCRATCINSGTYHPQQTVFPPTIHSTSTTGVCTQRPQVPPSSPNVKRLRGNFRSTSTFSPFIHLPLSPSPNFLPPSTPLRLSLISILQLLPTVSRSILIDFLSAIARYLGYLRLILPVHASSFADLLSRSLRSSLYLESTSLPVSAFWEPSNVSFFKESCQLGILGWNRRADLSPRPQKTSTLDSITRPPAAGPHILSIYYNTTSSFLRDPVT